MCYFQLGEVWFACSIFQSFAWFSMIWNNGERTEIRKSHFFRKWTRNYRFKNNYSLPLKILLKTNKTMLTLSITSTLLAHALIFLLGHKFQLSNWWWNRFEIKLDPENMKIYLSQYKGKFREFNSNFLSNSILQL